LAIYGSFPGPLAGLYLADYYLIHRQRFNLHDLYVPSGGKYQFGGGVNWTALLAYGLAVVPFLVCYLFNVPVLGKIIVDNSWIVCMVLSFVLYTALMRSQSGSLVSFEEFQELTETRAS